MKGRIFIDTKGLGNEFFLTGVRPWYAYSDGIKGDQCGYSYDVCVPAQSLERMTVKIPGEQKIEAPESGFIRVMFENLLVIPYVTSEGRIGLSATADSISVVVDKAAR
ncbi:MAG: hypothetical protein IJJ99_09095 [Oscillospiraceae bacterium]|nr:hypothetical protein [Oscillospiraceae bacterium]